MSRSEYKGYVIKGYGEGTKREHYDVVKSHPFGLGDRLASGVKSTAEARRIIREEVDDDE